ncbi:metalloregulator ArsR/SmtB family transcription factor [Candidatus Brachybacter algidus]|uniref:ArsR/SmtB family transcription factor n=1 Tax=Candidatus Brachybacter algidus TaxID=2982024 RepID=UPI001D2C3149|nr:metalloregulator ArsR/SmtB family transcription factor [Candidatus Brachybacter algidus]MBK6449649.1 winged helix-turn-helix transcriptional regulator [Candidatus Brachybacter algidus]
MRRDVYQAIADPTRRDIIGMLASESLNLNAISDKFEISRPAISKHIKILTECGLITIEQKGRERFCILQQNRLDIVKDWIESHKQFWNDKLDALDQHLSK